MIYPYVLVTIPITIEQIRELARQLSPQERQALIDSLLAERFDSMLAKSDQQLGGQPAMSDADVSRCVYTRQSHREMPPWNNGCPNGSFAGDIGGSE